MLQQAFKDLLSTDEKIRVAACDFFYDSPPLRETAKDLNLEKEELMMMASAILNEDGARSKKLLQQYLKEIGCGS
jgi:hypothetical protein|tara:strand:- start:13 stop:237 length:225 start_codon:yes stop_codon:yes gene_type:complete